MGRRKLPPALQAAVAAAEAEDTRPRAECMSLVLPFPPSVNALYPTVITPSGQMRRTKSKEAKRFFSNVRNVVGLWLNHHGLRPPAPPYRLTLLAYPPDDGHKHDLTNLFKAPEDAVMVAIGGDDNDVHEANSRKADPDGYPRLVLVLETIRREEV